jgi:hypothetical protein
MFPCYFFCASRLEKCNRTCHVIRLHTRCEVRTRSSWVSRSEVRCNSVVLECCSVHSGHEILDVQKSAIFTTEWVGVGLFWSEQGLNLAKNGNMYSLEYTDNPKECFTPRHAGQKQRTFKWQKNAVTKQKQRTFRWKNAVTEHKQNVQMTEECCHREETENVQMRVGKQSRSGFVTYC